MNRREFCFCVLCATVLGTVLSVASVGCLISGDMKHDQVVEAANRGVSLIDLGHFETERHFIPMMTELLSEAFPEVRFIPDESCEPLFDHI